MTARLTRREEGGHSWPVLTWAPGPGWRSIASTVVGGGIGECGWWLNTQVSREYHEPDPAAHVLRIATGLGLTGSGVGPTGPGVGMLTAADVTRFTTAEDDGIRAVATVGLGLPVWAAAAAEPATATPPFIERPQIGTINILVICPVPLADAALVNAVLTLTEAKTQALLEAGVNGSGTSSDAVCVACPIAGQQPEPYGGPRSVWGARIARAVHAAVTTGTADWISQTPYRR